METNKLMNDIINDLITLFPLFGNLIARLNFKYTKMDVPAPAFTDGRIIYYKDEFLTDFSYEEQKFIIAHEILHIVLKHFNRNVGKDKDLLNYVEDAIINQMLKQAGLTMPEGLVDVDDALLYSADELYLRLLPKLEEIKEWLRENTYHIDFAEIAEELNGILEGIDSSCNNGAQGLMKSNEELKNELAQIVADSLKAKSYGTGTSSIELDAEPVGESEPFLSWQELLEMSLSSPTDENVLFYEIGPDGILTKEEHNSEERTETEIIVDTSGSMYDRVLKLILRECKNILSLGEMKVGFCDTKFYGWHEIESEEDIDALKIKGRGGTDFEVMSQSFSENVTNKIVMTDGYCDFPEDGGDIIWLVIGWELPTFCNRKDLNIIFIDVQEIFDQLFKGTVRKRKRVLT